MMTSVALIRTNCPRCGSFVFSQIVKTPDYEMNIQLPFEVDKCSICDFIYTGVRPEYKTLFSVFYPDNYLCYGYRKRRLASIIDNQRMKKQALQRYNLIKKHIDMSRMNVLEVGCATGEFLKICLQHGDNACGIEPNHLLSESLKKNGVNMINSTLEEAEIKNNSFDLVCLFNVFEHLWDPVSSIYKLNVSLKSGGALILEVPDLGSPWRKIFHKHWFLYHLPRHLSHFTRNQLNELMAEFGFRSVGTFKQFRPTVNVLSLKYAVQSRFNSRLMRFVFSENNPVILCMAMIVEFVSNLFFNSNIMLCIYEKKSTLRHKPSLIREEQYEISGTV